jgi:predicted nuclease of predicted toxin-antitoxin system
LPRKSPLQLLADECVYQATTDFLINLGYDVVTAQALGLSGVDDDAIIETAISLNRALITRDIDFSNILLYPPAHYLGIVVLKMTPETMHAVHQMLTQALTQTQDLTGALLVIDKNKFRIRRLAPSQ